MGVYFGVESFYNVARVPAHSIGGFIGDCDRTGQDLVRAYPFDVNAVTLAIAARGRWVGAFYSTSALATAVPTNGFQRGLITTLNTAGGLYWMAAGPFYGAERSEVRETQTVFLYDYVVGGTVDLKVVQGAAGFVGSRGFYANLRSDRAHLFSDAIFSDGMQRVPMLAGGLGRLPLAGMLSSAYTRRLDIDATPLGDRAALARDALWTGHIDQELIAGMFDLKAALAVQPTVDFQEAVLRWHPPRDADELAEAGLTPDLLPGVWVGAVRALPLERYGIEGGTRVQAGVRYAFALDEAGADTGGAAVLSLSLNDDRTMDLFPYAKNTWYLRLSVTSSGAFDE